MKTEQNNIYRKYDEGTVLYSAEYVNHVSAMTREKLHSKSDIAMELAARDIEILALHEENEQLRARVGDALRFIDSFIDEHENKEVRIDDFNGFGYIDTSLNEHIDFSELVTAIKELNND